MKYINGCDALPEELLNEIRKYAEGTYIYIPKRTLKKNKWGENTNHHREMELRNLHIYDKYLEGVDVITIADRYHLSIKSIRRIILLEKRKMELILPVMKDIINKWNMEYTPVQVYHSAWNVNDTYVLKEYTDVNSLRKNIEMMKILYEADIPVPQIIPLPNGDDFLEQGDKLYVLMTKLKGKNIVNIQSFEVKWFYEFGSILAKLHLAFRKCEDKISYWNNSLLEEMNGWVSKELYEFQPEYLKFEDVSKAISGLSQVYHALPKQLIHRDVHLGNFLFDDGSFSGYIDFDLSQSNIRIFDLCYFLMGLLLKEDNNRVEEARWFSVVREVIKGYDALVALSVTEKESIACVMKNIELLFTAYFISIKDEKSAKDSAELFLFVLRNEERIQKAILM